MLISMSCFVPKWMRGDYKQSVVGKCRPMQSREQDSPSLGISRNNRDITGPKGMENGGVSESMSPASVTLASALQVRGEALSEEEIWSLLSLAAERLLEDLCDEAAPFKAPELLQGQSGEEQHDASQTKKAKSYLALRGLCVVLLSGQCLEVKCDVTSTVGAVFSAIAPFANLGELTYFGLAYLKDKEFFFLDAEIRLCKIAPEGWSEQPQKKSSPNTFVLFLRIKFFVSHYGLLQHSWTRHQFYLQLRKDILEEKLYCNDETLLQLGVLALQAEFGSYPEEVESKAYFRVEDYVPASLIERMTALRVQVEVSEMHRLSPVLWGEDAELEFLRVAQQLPEYGVLVYRVLPEKTRPEGEMALGICAKGVIAYEVRNNSRVATSRFQWREIEKILAYRKKFIITSSVTGKKHAFVTDSVKTCKYLLGLCCAQHGFNAQMSSPGVTSDSDKCVQMGSLSLAHLPQSNQLTWIQRLSCSENALFIPGLEDAAGGLLRRSLDNFTMDTSKGTGAQGLRGSPCLGREQLERLCLIQKPTTCDPLSGQPAQSTRTGFVINEGEDVGKVDPGIFISSIIPGGPAEKAKKIKPGAQILALNHISLEGFTFDMAVRMIQNSPDTIELIISQSKGDRLLQVDGVSLCGLTHKQAVQCLKGSGQPAEENGAIAVGDIILAVNGRSTEGLDFQEVLHLLRGASQEVTLLLCRPPPGALPEMDQGWQNTRLSTWRNLSRISFGSEDMSSPENAAAESGEDQKGKDSDMKNPHVSLPVSPHDDLPSSSHEDLLYSSCHDHLHLSSQETTPRLVNYKVFQNEVNSRKLKVFFRDFQHNDDFEDQFKDEAESENDGTLRKTSGFFLKQKSSGKDEELAGPSRPEIPTLQDDSTRVPLGENKDYINASYIKIANSGAEYYYIATQGPLPTTTDDFWQMVLENNSNVIAMITKEKEGGVTKCHHYWPISMQKPLELNSCCIFLENYQVLRYFIIRMFQVVKKSTGASHFVKHLQFTDWPDHGTPTSAEGFIKYVRYVRKSHLTGPIVVHCSAGVGRTGVFLCVDVVFCAIENNFSFDIMNIVGQMREQRHGMIQTKFWFSRGGLFIKRKSEAGRPESASAEVEFIGRDQARAKEAWCMGSENRVLSSGERLGMREGVREKDFWERASYAESMSFMDEDEALAHLIERMSRNGIHHPSGLDHFATLSDV
ncbi:hypothetical protein MG293_020478 [Ovis ammon polii]|uniref:Uncharacterized protein n=1 Tax=Ovis ammon polii TaxID=230172 RepID=A0AAD4TMX8_OVIAM|nr:hypothetical protein MG293_020478 [Ovis ammon polii]